MIRTFWKRAGLLLCFCQLVCISGVIAAELDRSEHVTSIEVFLDAKGSMDVHEVDPLPFHSLGHANGPGYFSGATWLRLKVRPAADGGPLFLRISPNNRSHLTLYAPDIAGLGVWSGSETGNAVAWQNRAAFRQYLGFKIQPQQETVYYLRMKTVGSGSLEVSALSEAESIRQEIIDSFLRLTYFLVILAIVAWGAHTFSLNRDPLVLAFALSHMIYAVLAFLSFGYFDVLFPASNIGSNVQSWMVFLTTTSSFVFHLMLLNHFGIPKPIRLIMLTVLALNLVSIGISLTGELTSALKLNSIAILLMTPTLFLAALFSGHGGVPNKRTRLVYYGLLLGTALFHLVPILGLVDIPWNSAALGYGHLIYGFISALLFGHFLHERAKSQLEASQAADLALRLSERELAWQKERLQEQENFTAMLTHELKNPLASIRLTVDALNDHDQPLLSERRKRISRAVQDIDALVERCVLLDSIEQGRLRFIEVDLDPEQLLQGVVARFSFAQDLDLSAAQDLPMMVSDQRLLEIALSNLVENAFKYTLDPKSVQVAARATEDQQHIVFEISNLLGSGERPELSQIFEKYHRGKYNNGHRGTGLGLFLVRWIAERLGGSISASFSQKEHIVFRLCLPLKLSQR